MKLVAVAPGVDPQRALEALVNGSTTVYGPEGGVRRIRASRRLGFVVTLTRVRARGAESCASPAPVPGVSSCRTGAPPESRRRVHSTVR
jgi:hypothetical protein